MRPPSDRRLALLGLGVALLLMVVFGGLVFQYGRVLRTEIRAKMIERDAAVLYPIAQQQIDAGSPAPNSPDPSASLLSRLLPDAHREGLLAMAIFDEDGVTLEQVPSDQLLVELPVEDFFQLLEGKPITRFFPEFSLSRIFPSIPPGPPVPVLELILPLRRAQTADVGPPAFLGFVRYHLDARALHRELTILDRSVFQKTLFALVLGVFSIGVIVAAAFLALQRAQRLIAQRNEQLIRANFELTLAAKASALGQITSHLIHGLQGPVASLRAMVANRAATDATDATAADWNTAADYTERMQTMIQEAVAFLGDTSSHATYELTGFELADAIRKRHAPLALQKGVSLSVTGGFDDGLDHHRGGLLCLIVSNLVQNAIEATDSGRTVAVSLHRIGKLVTATVSDEGSGISDEVRAHLFEPGRTGRSNGTGLGLAISQLLARQIDATLILESTAPTGTVFRLTLPW